MQGKDIKTILLEVIEEKDRYCQNNLSSTSLQESSILEETWKRLESYPSLELEQALLTCWHDLFRNGILAWGHDRCNPEHPFFHVTKHGKKILINLTRDPSNPDGYMAYLCKNNKLTPITASYILEALATYNNNCFKACAVMVGGATESLVLIISDVLKKKLEELDQKPSQGLNDWRIKRILTGIKNLLRQKKKSMPNDLYESFEAYWPSFTHQIRTVRNESGHPANVKNINRDTVHASLLIFPELAKLHQSLADWIEKDFK